jgi:hypothetical protein
LPARAGDSIPEPHPLPPGLYEQVVDQLLDRRLAVSRGPHVEVNVGDLDAGDSHVVLADYLRHLVRSALSDVTGDDRLERQVELVNRMIRVVEAESDDERTLSTPTRRLMAIQATESAGDRRIKRPDTPLALGCLLAGTRLDPTLVSQIRKAATVETGARGRAVSPDFEPRAVPVRSATLRLPAGDPRPARCRAKSPGTGSTSGCRGHGYRQDDDRGLRLPPMGSRPVLGYRSVTPTSLRRPPRGTGKSESIDC